MYRYFISLPIVGFDIHISGVKETYLHKQEYPDNEGIRQVIEVRS